MKQVVEELRATMEPPDFKELGTVLSVMADADKRQRGLQEVIIPMLKKETVMQSTIFRALPGRVSYKLSAFDCVGSARCVPVWRAR